MANGFSMLALLLIVTTPAWAADDAESKRAKIDRTAADTLDALYQYSPGAKAEVAKAAAYAVFDNVGTKILLAGGGKGEGVLVERSGRRTYMGMMQVQAGLGMGVKNFQQVFVFSNTQALNRFRTSGWEFGGQATASAKAGSTGAGESGGVSISPGVRVYQMTKTGLAAEVTVAGTRYYVSDELNKQ